MSELLAVSGLPSHAIGIDAGVEDALTEENIDGVSEVLKAFSRNNQAIVLATGKQDFVTDGERVFWYKMAVRRCPGSQEPAVWSVH